MLVGFDILSQQRRGTYRFRSHISLLDEGKKTKLSKQNPSPFHHGSIEKKSTQLVFLALRMRREYSLVTSHNTFRYLSPLPTFTFKKPLGRHRSMKTMAFKLNPLLLRPRLTPHLSGRLATYFATRARPELSVTVEFRLPLILRARSISTSRPKSDDVKAVPHGE